MFSFGSKKSSGATRFAQFIREASSQEKKRVYTEVLKNATERQRSVVTGRFVQEKARS
jgi:hypothetical protein